MKSTFKLTVYRDRDVTPGTFNSLCAIVPEGENAARGRFECELPLPDERADLLVACLARHGYRVWDRRATRQPHEISLRIDRTYQARDFRDAPALELTPVSHFHSGRSRDDQGRLVLETPELNLKLQLGMTGYYGLVASSALKETLEAAGLIGLDFLPVTLTGPARAVATRAGGFWELTSPIVLPRMSGRMRFYDAKDGTEVTHDGPPPFVYHEGPDFPAICSEPAEIYFASESWAHVPPFDLAMTHERPMGAHGLPIGSPRLYRALIDAKVRASWVPVRLD